MAVEQTRQILLEAQNFFRAFAVDLNEQIEIFEAGKARADSAYMSEWISRNFLKNIEHAQSRLKKYAELGDDLETYENLALEKTKEYLLRAQKVLIEDSHTKAISANFIPVSAHKKFASKSAVLLEQVNSLLQGVNVDVNVEKSKKSWLNEAFYQAIYFIRVRTIAFGLKTPRNGAKAIKELDNAMSELAQPPREWNPTKKTQKWLALREHYAPVEIEACLLGLRDLHSRGEAVDKGVVHGLTSPDFPLPPTPRPTI